MELPNAPLHHASDLDRRAYSVVGFRGQTRNSGKDNCRELAELILTVGNSELRIHCGQSVMRKFINDGAVVIAISLSFFAFGFALGTRVFDLDFQEVISALIAGAVCGVTVLIIEFHNSKKQLSAIRARLASS